MNYSARTYLRPGTMHLAQVSGRWVPVLVMKTERIYRRGFSRVFRGESRVDRVLVTLIRVGSTRVLPRRRRVDELRPPTRTRKKVYTYEGVKYPDHRTCSCGKLEFCPSCEREWFPWARSLRKGLA